MILGGVEQFAQQLALARVHLAEEGLAIGRLRGTVDQADQPGPHTVADRFQKRGDQGVQFTLGQYRGFQHDFRVFIEFRPLADGFQNNRATPGMAVHPDVAGGGQVLKGLVQDAGIVFDGAFKVLMGTSQSGVSGVTPFTGMW